MPRSTLSHPSSGRYPTGSSPTAPDSNPVTVLVRDAGAIPPPPHCPLWRSRRGRILGPLWIFYSPKAHRIVRLRGNIGYYAWLLLEADPEVVDLCEQPFSVQIKVDGRWRSALVDVWARMRDGRQLYIVAVYRNDLAGTKGRVKQRMRVLTAWAELTGTPLAVMPDTIIWRDPQYLANWAHILRFLSGRHRAFDLELGDFVLRAVTARGRMTLGDIESSLSPAEPTAVRAAIFRLLHTGTLHADLREQGISSLTVFTLS